MGIRSPGQLPDWFVMVINVGVKCTARKLLGFEKSIPTLTQVKLILSTDEWKWTENIYQRPVPVNGELCRLHPARTPWCTSICLGIQVCSHFVWWPFSDTPAVFFLKTCLRPPVVAMASGRLYLCATKYIILCNIIWFIRLFMCLIWLICPSVYLCILFISPSVRISVCLPFHPSVRRLVRNL